MKKAVKRPHRSAFLRKWWQLLIMVLAFTSVKAQGDAPRYSPINGYGFKYKRLVGDSVQLIPLFASPHVPYRAGALKYRESDSSIYKWTGTQWLKEGGGSSSDKLDSLHVYIAAGANPDTLYQYINGDSTLVGYIVKADGFVPRISSTDQEIARFNGTNGDIQGTPGVTADGSGNFTVPNFWSIINTAGLQYAMLPNSHGFSTPTASSTNTPFDFVTGSQTQSSGSLPLFRLATLYNQTGTAGATDFSIRRTETALGSGQHNFLALFGGTLGTTELFRIDRTGSIKTGIWEATPIATTYGGVPAGGTTGQTLVKSSNSDYDVAWGAGSGGSTDTTEVAFPLTVRTGTYDTLAILRDSAYMVSHIIQDTLGTNLSPRSTAGSLVEYPDGHLVVGYSFYFDAAIGDQDSAKIAFKRSYDRGATWTDPNFVTPPGGGKLTYVPSLMLIGDTLHMIAPVVNATVTNSEFYHFKSVDTGKTWNAGVNIDWLPGMKTHGSHRLFRSKSGRIFYPWAINTPGSGTSSGTGHWEGRLSYSDDNMVTWTMHPTLEVISDDSAVMETELHETNDSLIYTWRGRSGWMLYIASGDNGNTWTQPAAVNQYTANFGIQKPNSMHSIKQIHNDRLWVAIINPVVDGFINNSADGRRRVQILASTSGKPGTFYPAQSIKFDTTGGRSYGDINICITTDYAYALYYVANRNSTRYQYELTRIPLNKFSYMGITDSLPRLLVKKAPTYYDTTLARITADKSMPAGVNDVGGIDFVTMPRNGAQVLDKFMPGLVFRGYGSGIATGGIIQAISPTNSGVGTSSNWDAGLVLDFKSASGVLSNYSHLVLTNNANAPYMRTLANGTSGNLWLEKTLLTGSQVIFDGTAEHQVRDDASYSILSIYNNVNSTVYSRLAFGKNRGASAPNTNDVIGSIDANGLNSAMKFIANGLTNSTTGGKPIDWLINTVDSANVSAEAMRVTSQRTVGIGTQSPTALLHIAAGATSATRGAFKLTLGSDLTTAETGSFEYAASSAINRLAFTPTGTTRKRIPLMNDVTPASGGILQGDGSNFTLLGLGTSLQQLRVNAGGTALEYFTPAGSSGTDNANVGAGYRILKPGTQEIKTLFAGAGVTIDSTTNTDGLTIIASGSGTPGGADTDVQYNDGGVLGGESSFRYNETNNSVYADSLRTLRLQSPLILGGVATTSGLVYQTTTGVGATGANHTFLVGNNGADTALIMLNNKNIGFGFSTPTYKVDLRGTLGVNMHLNYNNNDEGLYVANGNGLQYILWNAAYNGSTVTAKATTATGMAFSGAQGIGYANTGLTAGNTFTLTERFRWNQNGFGIGTTGPDRTLDVLHASNPQQRWTNVDGTTYGELFVNTSGNYIWSGSNTSPLFGLGGSTSSFPGLLRDGAAIQVRLADNSANAPLKVLNQAYDASTWDGNDEVPTKNAIRDLNEGNITQTLWKDFTITASTGTTETDLYTYTTPANTLSIDGQFLEYEISGVLDPTSNNGGISKTLRFYWAGTVIHTQVSTLTNFSLYTAIMKVVRVSSSNVRVFITLTHGAPGSGTAQTVLNMSNDFATTFSGTNIIKITGQSANASEQMDVRYGVLRKTPN